MLKNLPTPFPPRALLMLLLLLVACLGNGCSNQVTTSNQGCQPVAEATPPPPSTGSGALIVTDISGSMNGFAIPGSVRLFTVHEALERAVRNSITATEPTPSIRRCYLGNNLDCQRQLNLRELDKSGTYTAKESRLDLFMLPASQNANDQNAKPAEDPVDPYRIAVLVTDGMQARAANSNSAAPCLAGADPDCMAHLLRQRAQQGYGIWMALMLLPFKGTHYAERPLDESLWQKIQQHASGLSQEPFFQGVSFSVKRAGTSVPFESYQFEGVKPLMVLALSKDLQAGRAFIQQLSDTLKREGVVQPANAVYTMELAPLSVRPRQITKIALSTSGQVEGARPVFGKPQKGFYDYLIECDRNGVATLSATSEERQATQAVPEGVKVEFSLVPLGTGGLSPSNLALKTVADNSYEMRLSCQQIKEGSYENCLNLQANLKLDPQPNVFWNALHADNMYEAPERLYGLRDMVQKVIEAAIEKPRVTDRVRFRVERK